MWSVGLDWADTHHDVVVLDEAGQRVDSRRFAHSHDGLNELKQCLLSIAASPDQLACIVETSHGLLIAFLLAAISVRLGEGDLMSQRVKLFVDAPVVGCGSIPIRRGDAGAENKNFHAAISSQMEINCWAR